ncbi:MAG: magnesium transporter [Acidobacteria bacterium]|nr:magnesium transporter [Acidobacteriota bacterium]
MLETVILEIRSALGQHAGAIDLDALASLVRDLHAPDIAFILDELTLPEAERVFGLVDDDRAAEVLVQVAESTRRHFLAVTPLRRLANLLRRLPVDDVAQVVSAAGEDGERILTLVAPADARAVERLLDYPEQTAGRLMTTSVPAVPQGTSVGRTFEYLRVVAPDVETINTVYVVDGEGRLVGVCSIRELLISRSQASVDAIMHRDVVTVAPEMDQQQVARLIGRYDLLAVPVVDARQKLLGIVTIDDVLDVLTEEFEEDYTTLVGSAAAEMDRRTPVQIARLRLPWLLGTMAIELGAGAIIARFDAVLREVILLASFMPVISAVSGNVGLQAAAIVVRGLDTGHVSLDKWAHTVRRELLTALTIAATAGAILAMVGIVWSSRYPFGLVVGAAMTCAILAAGLMGTIIPMLSKRLGFDPAVTAGPFETAFQDVVGFTVFLWMASLLLHWLV